MPSPAANPVSLAAAGQTLARQVAAWTPPPARPCRARFSVPVHEQSPLAWLAVQPHSEKLHWADRDASLELAGVGSAHELIWEDRVTWPDIVDTVRRYLGDGPECRYLGGAAFRLETAAEADHWRPFGAARFRLPRLELVREQGALQLACNLVVTESNSGPSIAAALADISRLATEVAGRFLDLPRPTGALPARPSRSQWDAAVAEALRLIELGELDKIVLAASSGFRYEHPPDPPRLLARLRELTAGCYHFCFQLEPHLGFIGATPELLYQRRGRELLTEAVAGTRRRGATPLEDRCFAEELLDSAKDRREHQFVVDFLRQALAPCCADLTTDNLSVLKLARVQHLCVHVAGRLHPEMDDATVLSRLHPTPAVGGWPAPAAVARIAQLEPMNRGWYAGPIGWIGQNALQFGVAIRSGLVSGSHLWLFAGAGLVSGSQADQEWQEIDDKLSTFRKAAGDLQTAGDQSHGCRPV